MAVAEAVICDPRKEAKGSFCNRPRRRLFPLDNAGAACSHAHRILAPALPLAGREGVICGSPLSPVFIPDYCQHATL